MAYVFGAAVTDNVHTTGLAAGFTTNRTSLVSCWVRPTTLTAGRVIWANGTIWALSIDTTTSSVRLTADTATTDGVFTAPVGLALNTWTYIAVLVSAGTGPAMAVRIWSGTESTGPVERTVTVATTPTGAFTSGGSTFTVGNTNAGSVAFQGEIGGVVYITDPSASEGNLICSVASTGVISQAQANQVLAAFVDPLWKGDVQKFIGMGRIIADEALNGLQFAMSLDNFSAGGAWQTQIAQRQRATNTGGTAGARTPRSFDDQTTNPMGPARRAFLTRA